MSPRIEQADWLDFVRTLQPGSIDLLYADPPFNTGARQASGAGAFDDRWPSTAAWVAWLRERLDATRPALAPTASVLIHVDWRTAHHVRVVLGEMFGEACFVNHLIWAYGLGGSSPRRFARKHDDILFFAAGSPDGYFFDPPMVPATSNRMKGELKKATDVLDIPAINNMAAERTGWPTQKPLALLQVLIGACCRPDGTVLDPCCGSGTTLVAAARLGRDVIGCDLAPDAVSIARSRLNSVEPSPPG
ncbi:MAG: site-specific DNA-methyltransferase [Planctomycetota bacterium]